MEDRRSGGRHIHVHDTRLAGRQTGLPGGCDSANEFRISRRRNRPHTLDRHAARPVGSRYFLLATATLPPPSEKREVGRSDDHVRAGRHGRGGCERLKRPTDKTRPVRAARHATAVRVVINISGNQLAPVGEVGETVQRDELPIVVDQKLVDQATAVVRLRGLRAEGQEAGRQLRRSGR